MTSGIWMRLLIRIDGVSITSDADRLFHDAVERDRRRPRLGGRRARPHGRRRLEEARAGQVRSQIKPRMANKAMVYSFLQRRIPIIFDSRRGALKPGESADDKPVKIFKSLCSPSFPFEMTVAFRLASDRKGFIDLSDPTSWKMEGAHQAIFRDGDLLQTHGAALRVSINGSAEPTNPAAKRRTCSDVLAALCQLADAAERFVPGFDEEAA